MAVYYCDQSIGTASGAGTIGDPFGTLQYALSTIDRSIDAVTGDVLHLTGDASGLSALTVSTSNNPLLICGYATTAYDLAGWDWRDDSPATLPTIDFGSSTDLWSSVRTDISWQNVKIVCRDVTMNSRTKLLECDFVCREMLMRVDGQLERSRVTGISGYRGVSNAYGQCVIRGNCIHADSVASGYYGISLVSGSVVQRNRMTLNGINVIGIRIAQNNAETLCNVANNSIVMLGSSGYQEGIQVKSGYMIVESNVVVGATRAISDNQLEPPTLRITNNKFYDCDAGVDFQISGNSAVNATGNATLSSAPYTDPSTGDWTLSDELSSITDGYGVTPGAVQATATGGVAAVHPLGGA